MQHLLFITLVIACSGCSLFKATTKEYSKLTIITSPPAASVYFQNQLIGKTPLTVSDHKLLKSNSEDFASFTIIKDQYRNKTVIIERGEYKEVKITLTRQRAEDFENICLKNFSSDFNDLIRKLLTIQGHIIVRDFKNAQLHIDTYIKQYPYIASLYTLNATIAIANNKLPKAKGLLLQALALDPQDTSAQKLLKKISPALP